jgi:hypothetical protein
MRTVKVTTPSGNKVIVKVEEGMTDNDIFKQALVQEGAWLDAQKEKQDQIKATENTSALSFLDDVPGRLRESGKEIVGAAEAAVSTATSIINAPLGMAYGILSGSESEAEIIEKMSKFTYQPKTEKGQRNMNLLAEGIDKSKLAGMPPFINVPGRFKGGAITRRKIKTNELPTRSSIKDEAALAYKRAEEMGATIKTSEFKKFANQLTDMLRKKGYREGNTDLSSIKVIVEELNILSKKKGGVTLDDLQALRELSGSALKKTDPQANMLGLNANHALDDFLGMVDESKLTAGNPQAFAQWRLGRKKWGQQAKIKEMEWLQEKANLTDIGKEVPRDAQIENFRQEVVKLLKNPKKLKMYSTTDKLAMSEFVQGGKVDKFLGVVSGLGPKTAGGMVGLGSLPAIAMGVNGLDSGALTAGILGAGFAAGRGAGKIKSSRTAGRADSLMNKLRRGDESDGNEYGIGQMDIYNSAPLAVGGGLLDGVYDQYSGVNDAIEGSSLEEEIPL